MARSAVHAWVIHRRPYRDNSVLLELLTDTLGRVTAVWRRPKKGFQGEPFILIQGYLSGKANVLTLSKVEPIHIPFQFPKHRVFSALYLNELLVRLVRDQAACEPLFEAYRQAIASLASPDVNEALTLRQFETYLLLELGVLPDFKSTSAGYPIDPNSYYRISIDAGVEQHDNGIVGSEVLALAEGRFSRVAHLVYRQLIDALLGDKPLASRLLYKKMLEEIE